MKKVGFFLAVVGAVAAIVAVGVATYNATRPSAQRVSGALPVERRDLSIPSSTEPLTVGVIATLTRRFSPGPEDFGVSPRGSWCRDLIRSTVEVDDGASGESLGTGIPTGVELEDTSDAFSYTEDPWVCRATYTVELPERPLYAFRPGGQRRALLYTLEELRSNGFHVEWESTISADQYIYWGD